VVQQVTHFLENTPGPYYKVVRITSLSLYHASDVIPKKPNYSHGRSLSGARGD